MTESIRIAGIIALFIFSVTCARPANADILVMKNGDKITGEIKRIWDGEISIEPEYSDEFEVDIPAVDHIISDREFEIELEDGRELIATMGGADESGNQVLKTEAEAVAVTLADFLEVDEPEDFYDWETNVDLSSNFNRGNTDSSNSQLRSDAMFKHGDHRHRGEVTFIREEQNQLTTKEKDLFQYGYNWLFGDPWFLAGQLSFERDPIIQLDGRAIAAVGLGRDIWDTPRRSLNFALGLGVQEEDIGGDSATTSVATWTLRFGYDLFNGDMELFHNQDFNSNLSGRTNANFNTSTGLRFEITDLLYLNLTLDFDYQTHPVTGINNEDIAFLFGFGWSHFPPI